MKTECSICAEIRGDGDAFGEEYRSLVESGEMDLLRTDIFAVMPSIGPLNESHVLLSTTSHEVGMASLQPSALRALANLMNLMRKFARDEHGWEMLFFEHGTGNVSDTSGGCVEHAHLHGIREIPGVTKMILDAFPWVKLNNLPQLARDANRTNGYAFFSDECGQLYLSNNPRSVSQRFRQIYAMCQKEPGTWNWRISYRIPLMQDVIKSFDKLRSCASEVESKRPTAR